MVSEVPDIILKCVSRDEAALAMAQKAYHFSLNYSEENFFSFFHLQSDKLVNDRSLEACMRMHQMVSMLPPTWQYLLRFVMFANLLLKS